MTLSIRHGQPPQMELRQEFPPTNRLVCLSPYVADGPRKLELD
jgi:hypothetical protein